MQSLTLQLERSFSSYPSIAAWEKSSHGKPQFFGLQFTFYRKELRDKTIGDGLLDVSSAVQMLLIIFRGGEPRVMQLTGAGLGLAIVKEIVELHGGRVMVQSQAREGSTFTVWLPVSDRG